MSDWITTNIAEGRNLEDLDIAPADPCLSVFKSPRVPFHQKLLTEISFSSGKRGNRIIGLQTQWRFPESFSPSHTRARICLALGSTDAQHWISADREDERQLQFRSYDAFYPVIKTNKPMYCELYDDWARCCSIMSAELTSWNNLVHAIFTVARRLRTLSIVEVSNSGNLIKLWRQNDCMLSSDRTPLTISPDFRHLFQDMNFVIKTSTWSNNPSTAKSDIWRQEFKSLHACLLKWVDGLESDERLTFL